MQTYASSHDAQHGVQNQSGNLKESAGSDVFNHEQENQCERISNHFSEDGLEQLGCFLPI